MNFIEVFFGVAPDGGNGSTEFVVIAFLVAVAFVIYRRRKTLKAGFWLRQ